MEIFTVSVIPLSLKQPRAVSAAQTSQQCVCMREYAWETSKIRVENCFLFSLLKLDGLLDKDD